MEKRNVATSAREKDDRELDSVISTAASVINSARGAVKRACADISAARESVMKAREADEAADAESSK